MNHPRSLQPNPGCIPRIAAAAKWAPSGLISFETSQIWDWTSEAKSPKLLGSMRW